MPAFAALRRGLALAPDFLAAFPELPSPLPVNVFFTRARKKTPDVFFHLSSVPSQHVQRIHMRGAQRRNQARQAGRQQDDAADQRERGGVGW